MINEIAKDKEFYIISRSIDNAERCRVIDASAGCFTVKLENGRKYEAGETAELFSITPKNRLYFETIVKEAADDIVCLRLPLDIRQLQRREYFRTSAEGVSITIEKDKSLNASISDISAGGLKIITDKPLEILKIYKVSVYIGSRLINTDFRPVRIEAFEKGFISSGKFENIANNDRIALIQYCFGRQTENSNL